MEAEKLGSNPGKQNKVKRSFIKTVCVTVLLLVFTVLLVGGYWIFKTQAPRPLVTDSHGHVLFTKDSIKGGQAVFQKYALMDYGTVLGNGSYMGPDYTAEALKIYTEGMHDFHANKEDGVTFAKLSKDKQTVIRENEINEMRKNRYTKKTDTLVLTDAQAHGLKQVENFYQTIFTKGDGWGLQPNLIKEQNIPSISNSISIVVKLFF
jgi:nitric oxide reductase subunit B